MLIIETPFEELQLNITEENTDEALNAIMTLENTKLVAATLLVSIIVVVILLCKNMKMMRQSQPLRRTEPEWIGLKSAEIMTSQNPRRANNSETTAV